MTELKQHIPVFISSTYVDLIPYRKAVWEKIDNLKIAVNGMEIFGARSAEALETCVHEVAQSQIFVAILAMRFGSIVPETGKSFVQVEYETAIEKGIETLIYVIDEENAVLAPRFVDIGDSAQKLKEFKEFLNKRHTTDVFSSPEDLATKIERDLLRLFRNRQFVIDDDKLRPLTKPEETLELLKKFRLMPDRYKGQEVELIIEFSDLPESVSDTRCKALELPLGNSLSREIKVIEPAEASYSFLSNLYAQYKGCDFLYDSPSGRHFKVICRLVFGIEIEYVIRDNLSSFLPSSSPIWRPPPEKIERGVKAIVFVKTGEDVG